MLLTSTQVALVGDAQKPEVPQGSSSQSPSEVVIITRFIEETIRIEEEFMNIILRQDVIMKKIRKEQIVFFS